MRSIMDKKQMDKSTGAVLTSRLMVALGGGEEGGGASLMYLFPCRAHTGGPALILHKSITLTGTG